MFPAIHSLILLAMPLGTVLLLLLPAWVSGPGRGARRGGRGSGAMGPLGSRPFRARRKGTCLVRERTRTAPHPDPAGLRSAGVPGGRSERGRPRARPSGHCVMGQLRVPGRSYLSPVCRPGGGRRGDSRGRARAGRPGLRPLQHSPSGLAAGPAGSRAHPDRPPPRSCRAEGRPGSPARARCAGLQRAPWRRTRWRGGGPRWPSQCFESS